MATLIMALLAHAAGPGPEERAIAYLAREVPLWSQQNHCYSCHNNGDGARALYAARRLGYATPAEALADTTAWLERPLEWDNNRGDPRSSDKRLARIQFAAALVEAFDAGVTRDRKILAQAAESLLPHQHDDGSWPVDAEAAVGSPATYGPVLATALALRTLRRADPERFRQPIARAERWLGRAPARSTLDAAALLLALGEEKREWVSMLLSGQGSGGGWGPYAKSPPEPFDTALALLALANRPEAKLAIRRGREYLAQTQLETGGWTETTRPAGGQTYAQHVSTSGWATLALIETRGDIR